MPVASATDLVSLLNELQLLSAAQLQELTGMSAESPDPRPLARTLVQRGWLTPFQVNLLFQERGKELVLGPYVLLEKLNEGGMGVIYKAQHRHMKRLVAVKVIKKERLERADIVRRFFREILASGQFDHPNIVRALDADEVGGTLFLVMEYIAGLDLARLVKKRGPLPVAEACEYIRQAALGLQHAYELGVVHRDIKPGNILVSGGAVSGEQAPLSVKLLDMGLARIDTPEGTGGSLSALTKAGTVMGTPDYIAPEQALDSHHADTRADLYSLGCTFYFLLTGKPPFPGGSHGDKLLKHRFYPPEPVEAKRPDVPPGVVGVVNKLMAKRVQDRHATPAELAQVLADGLQTGAWPTPPAITAVVIPPAVQAAVGDLGWSTIVSREMESTPASGSIPMATFADGRRRWLPWAIGGGATAFGCVILAVALFMLGADKTPTTRAGSIALSAERTWQDTHIDVVSGDTLLLFVSGTWKKGTSDCSAPGLPDLPHERCVLRTAPLMCLLGRIGDQDPPMDLSKAPVIIQARRNGRLFLQANDLDLGPNSGELQIRIEGGKFNRLHAKLPEPTAVQLEMSGGR